MRFKKRFYAISVILAVIAPLFVSLPAQAAPVTATGTNPSVCNQEVDVTTGVTSVRLANGNCVVKFSASSTVINWTVPAGITAVEVLVVAGGGGGGSRHAGGGGAGGVMHVTNYKVTPASSLALNVGAGGAGAAGGANSGGGSNGNDSYFGGASGSTSIRATGGGVGGSGGTASGSGGSSGGTNHESSASGNATPGSAGDVARTAGASSSLVISGVTATVNAYGAKGGVGLGSACYGSDTRTGWCGGGGGGAGSVGAAPALVSSPQFKAGNGGNGISNSITGTAVTYGGGGGGGSGGDFNTYSSTAVCASSSAQAGNGGSGGGGAGGVCANAGSAGTANTGGGGGGGGLYYVAGNSNTNGAAGAGGSGVVIISYTTDTTAPTISTAVLNSSGTSIVLTYNETLSATTAATSAFAVSDSGTAVSVSSVTASGFTITLALASTINIGRVVTLSYTDPTGSDDASAIQDSNGNDAISLSSRSVTNNSTVKSTPTFSAWSNVTKTFGDANYTVTAPTVTGSLAGSFSYGSSSSAVISISGTTFTVAGGGSATITATFTPTDTVNYNSTTTTNTVTVNKAAQTAITITTTTATYGSDLTLASTGGSTGGTYNYSKVSGNCSLSGAVLTPTATGSCVVQSNLATTTNYLPETSTATTITISSGSVGASLTLAPGNLTFRQAKNITAVSTVAGKITFRVAGKILPGCKNRIAVGSGSSFTAICSYKPSNHSYVTITATLVPTDSYYTGTVTSTAQYLVTRRTGAR
jgi:uncharacterized repeat protein (TIGR02059 family)